MKERLDAEKRMREEGRLPPGQSLTLRFPILHYGPVPEFVEKEWEFKIFGEVKNEVKLNWKEFCSLPTTEVEMDIHCVTAWSKKNTKWKGVTIKTLIDLGLFLPKNDASFIIQHCELGYTTNLPLKTAIGDNFILATHYEGKPLAPEHGYPLRGVCGAIPNRKELDDIYLWKGGKWLRGIEACSEDKPGFWEKAGYHNRGNVWKEERFVT